MKPLLRKTLLLFYFIISAIVATVEYVDENIGGIRHIQKSK